MIQFDKWKMPDGEKHLQEWMKTVNNRVDGRLTYQYSKYEAAMRRVKYKRNAIDIGAHIGLWSFYMARDFANVFAFEPNPPHQECWYMNMQDKFNAELFDCALGEKSQKVAMETRTSGSSGDTQIALNESGEIYMEPLDDFEIDDVDFIKIDCEGYEDFIIRGAEETIRKSKPCIIVEQKPGHSKRYSLGQNLAVKRIESWGAEVRQVISGDYILSWD